MFSDRIVFIAELVLLAAFTVAFFIFYFGFWHYCRKAKELAKTKKVTLSDVENLIVAYTYGCSHGCPFYNHTCNAGYFPGNPPYVSGERAGDEDCFLITDERWKKRIKIL